MVTNMQMRFTSVLIDPSHHQMKLVAILFDLAFTVTSNNFFVLFCHVTAAQWLSGIECSA